MRDSTRNDDEVTIEKANGSGNDGKYQNNEGAVIKGTCETEMENVIIVHENLRRLSSNRSSNTSAAESAINNKLSVENEANLAIEMLDTVLEGEDESESLSSRRVSWQSIKIQDVNVPVITTTGEVYNEESSNETTTTEQHGKNIDRFEISKEIDEIQERAEGLVAEMKFNETQSFEDENVFKNQKFLAHLNELIAKSNQQTSQLNVQSKTLNRKSNAGMSVGLKHSKSAPDFKLLMQQRMEKEASFNDDTSVDYDLSDDETPRVTDDNDDYGIEIFGDKEVAIPPLPPVFNAELFEKVATLKRREKPKDDKDEHEIPRDDVDEVVNVISLEDESVNIENFRDKLEKLLSAPPTRLSLIAPVPLPRTSLVRKNDNNEQQPSPREPVPVSATMQKQRELFDEVLKNLKHNEEDEKLGK